MIANIELQNKWTLLRIVLNFDRKLPHHLDSLSLYSVHKGNTFALSP